MDVVLFQYEKQYPECDDIGVSWPGIPGYHTCIIMCIVDAYNHYSFIINNAQNMMILVNAQDIMISAYNGQHIDIHIDNALAPAYNILEYGSQVRKYDR